MNTKLFRIAVLMMLTAALLSACVGGGTAGVATSWPGVLATSDAIYLASGAHVYALDPNSGVEKWRYPAEADAKISFYAAPALTSDGQLLVGGFDNTLYSLNPASGAVNWQFKAGDRFISSPLVGPDAIYAPNADGYLYALDLKGNLLWRYEGNEEPLWATPVSDPDCSCLFVASMDHRVHAVDAKSGKSKWVSEGLGGSMVGTPAYQDGVLYVGTFGAEMLALDAQNGKVLWRVPTSGWVWGAPAYREGRLYFGDLQGTFYALEAANGATAWTLKPDGQIAQSPLLTEDALYFATKEGSLYALNYDGGSVWNFQIEGQLQASPLLAGDKILVAPTGKEELLYALNLTGGQMWSFTPAKEAK
ncbi:MAG: PQQ-binding-like beta-propeller repeat protein [Chloroflexi bacterium]|nr:PQQ-binding-like beta-propeller repeat protein [Chloroflexota bacterium]